MLVTCLVVGLFASAAWAQMPQIPSFSADMQSTTHNGQNVSGKVNFGNMHMRMAMSMHGQDVVMIVDLANTNNPKATMLMVQQKMYMEMNGMGRQAAPKVRAYDPNNPCASMEGTTCKKTGVETVNGYACDKWEFTGKENQTVWISQKMHFPIKTVQQDGTTTEFTNITEGPQDPSLFAIPSDYKKFDPMGMAGGRPQ